MAAIIIDGKAAAAELRAQVAEGVAAFRERHGRPPGLAGIQVGTDPASELYQAGKARAAEEAGWSRAAWCCRRRPPRPSWTR